MIIDFDIKRFIEGEYLCVQVQGYKTYGIERIYYIGDNKKGDYGDIALYGLIYNRENPDVVNLFGWDKEGRCKYSIGDFRIEDGFFDLKLEVANTGENKNSNYLYIGEEK